MKLFTVLHSTKTLMLAGVFITSAASFAQTNFTIHPTGAITDVVDCDTPKEFHFYVDNANPTPVTLEWKVTINTLPLGQDIMGENGCWSNQLCDWNLCKILPDIGVVQSPSEIPANTLNNDMKLLINPMQIKGSGQVVIEIYEVAHPTNSKTLTWNITGCSTGTTCTVGIPENEVNNLFAVYPNPAQNYITMERVKNNNAVAIGTVQIYSLVGEKLLQFNEANNNLLKMDISSLPAGAYFVKRYNATEGTSVKQFFKIK